MIDDLPVVVLGEVPLKKIVVHILYLVLGTQSCQL